MPKDKPLPSKVVKDKLEKKKGNLKLCSMRQRYKESWELWRGKAKNIKI